RSARTRKNKIKKKGSNGLGCRYGQGNHEVAVNCRGNHNREARHNSEKLVESSLTYPVFVKPANLGSSVGISKAHNRKELGPAIEEAAKFDRKIVIEHGVGGKKEKAREIECSVLGNDEPSASVPGEIVPGKEFYDYTAKYVDEGSQLIIPAKLTKAETKKVQDLAVAAFKAVEL